MAEGRSPRSLPHSIPQSNYEQIPPCSSVLLLGSKDFPPLNPQISSNGAAANLLVSQSGHSRSYIESLNNINNNIQASSASTKLSLDVTKMVDGKSTAIFTSGELKTHISICESYVVGYFVGKRHQFPFVKEKLTTQWKTKGDFSMTIHGNHFLFKFVLEEDRAKVLELGSVNIGKSPFLVRPWSSSLEKNIDSVTSVPVWMNLRQVPLHLWNQLGLSRIASIVGTPIMTDTPTALKTRMSYARVCVEVAADCSFPTELPIQIDDIKFVVKAEYPWKPIPCSHCKSFGHSSAKCSLNPAPMVYTKWVPKAKASTAKSVIGPLSIHEANTNEESGTQGVADLVNVPGEKEVVVSQLQVVPISLGVNPVSSLLTSKGVASGESSVLPSEKWTSYSRKNKKKSALKGDVQKDIGLLNPFDVLFSEDELANAGFREKSSSHRVEEGREEDNVVEVAVGTCVVHSSAEELQEDNIVEIPQDFFEELPPASDDLNVIKEKSLVEIPRRLPMTKAQNVERLLKFVGMIEDTKECPIEDKKNLLNFIADKHQKSRKERELESLGCKGDPSNDKLGRGLRNSAKKKF